MLILVLVIFILFIAGIGVFIAANAGRGQDDWNSFFGEHAGDSEPNSRSEDPVSADKPDDNSAQ